MARRKRPQTTSGRQDETIDIYRNAMSNAELLSLRRNLAKRANQRMVRLERAESKITGETYTYGAYDIAQDYLKGKKRFSENKNYLTGQRNALQREILELQRFLTSKSSTVKGQRAAEAARVHTFTKDFDQQHGGGRRISKETAASKEFYQFLNSKVYSDAISKGKITSGDLIEKYDAARRAGKSDEQINDIINEWERTSGASEKSLERALNLQRIPNSANK